MLSGLGVDDRVFDTFEFKNKNIVFISWITPLQHDALPSYATRVAEQIKEDYFMLMGAHAMNLLWVKRDEEALILALK